MIVARPFLASLLLAAAAASCNMTKLIPGRCEKQADCSGGLTCDDHKTCVPPTPGPSPCSSSEQCGSGYICDNLQWCVCQNQGVSADNDPCADGRLPTYRGVETDGGVDGGDGGDGGDAGDGGDGGFKCKGDGDCTGGAKSHCIVSTGVCVECTATESTQCNADPARPICDTAANTCVPCATDAQCVAKLGSPDPGICMSHQDGHCASDAEVVYVKLATPLSNCPSTSTPGAGTASLPFCQINQALASGSTRRVVVVRGDRIPNDAISNTAPVSIIGQQGAAIGAGAGSPGLHISGTDVYIRAMRISGGSGTDIGIVVDGSAVVRLNTVQVEGMSKGGILLDGAAFDIENVTVTNCGTGDDMGASWGGFRIKNAPASGPTRLNLVTVQNSMGTGVSCTFGVNGATGVLVSGTTLGVDVSPTCGFSPCGGASSTCGAQ